jgi:hypothetical protein
MGTKKIDVGSLGKYTHLEEVVLGDILNIFPETIDETYRQLQFELPKFKKTHHLEAYEEQLVKHLRALIRSRLNKEGIKNVSHGRLLLSYAPAGSIEWIRIFTEVLRMVEKKEDAKAVWNLLNSSTHDDYKNQALKKLAEFYVVEE